jgi:circadian clock protein KaiC
LKFESARPSLFGLEMHLARMYRDIDAYQPSAVVVDPISAFRGVKSEIHATLLRLADICKSRGITAVFTSLSLAADHVTEADRGVSSLMDTWISLTDVEASGERNRVMSVLKSRGMNHSNQLREYLLTDHGVELIEPYVGTQGVLTGAARLVQAANEREAALERSWLAQKLRREFARKRATIERQIADLKEQLDQEEEDAERFLAHDEERESAHLADRSAMASKRGAHP